jgi:hypothetical protein
MRTTLVPVETPLRRVVALGPDVFVSPDAGGLARVDLASGRLTPLAAPMKDRWGTPSVFSGLARRGSGLLLASTPTASGQGGATGIGGSTRVAPIAGRS